MHQALQTEGLPTSTPIRAQPNTDDVRAQLERILSSPEFPKIGRGAAFLRYVVDETLEGRGGRIKGYCLAIEVFGRDEGFTQDDPVVRIEAGRLRRALERYYLVAGQDDPVRIDIPKGGYVPAFAWMDSTHNPATSQDGDTENAQRRVQRTTWGTRRALWIGAIGIGVPTLLSVWFAGDMPRTPASTPQASAYPDRPELIVGTFTNLDDGSAAVPYSHGLTEELLTALPKFKEIKVFDRQTSRALAVDADAPQATDEPGAGYLLTGAIRSSASRLRVTARLIDISDKAIIWSQDYENALGSADLLAIQAEIAGKIATAIAQPYGIMSRSAAAHMQPANLGTYDCTLRFYSYRAELSREAHEDVRTCLESVVTRYPSFSTAWAMLSIVYLDEDRFGFASREANTSALQRSLQTSRRAVQLDPHNTRALQAQMTALFFNKQQAESRRIGELALASNPNDSELIGELGARLTLSGQWQRGATLLDRATLLNPGSGGYYHGLQALAAYMVGDNQAALAKIRLADLQKFPFFHAVAAMIYAEAGLTEEANRARHIFVELQPGVHPHIRPNILSAFEMPSIQPTDRDRLFSGLRKAGILVPEHVGSLVPIATAPDPQPW